MVTNRTSNEAIRARVDSYFAAISGRDMDAWVANFSDDIISFSPVGGPVIQGIDGMRLLFKEFLRTVREVEVRPDSIFVAGGGAAAKWTARGVGHNDRPVTFEGINVYEMNEAGRIKCVYAYYDPNAVLMALQ